jgi:Peptidase propeptide and YPEB domain
VGGKAVSESGMFIRSSLSLLNRCGLFLSVAACAFALEATMLGATPEARAKITKEQAEKIALTRVPDGTIKSAELETEHGKLIWSFDISRPKTASITEIQVDAKKGLIVSKQTETPSQQATESQEDKKQGG